MFLKHNTPICLQTVYGCILITTAGLSSHDREHTDMKPKIFIMWSLQDKFADPFSK